MDVGGYLARTAYEIEMETIRNLWNGAPGNQAGLENEELHSWLRGRALHSLKFFTFHPSTPAVQVSVRLEEAFFSCSAASIFSFIGVAPSASSFPIISSLGVHPAGEVRMPDEAFSGFVKGIPVLPLDVLSGARKIVDKLRERGMIPDISFQDIIKELSSRPLAEPEVSIQFCYLYVYS